MTAASDPFTIRVTFDGIFTVEGKVIPCLAYSYIAERPDGQTRHIKSSVGIYDELELARLRRDFKPGDEIDLTLQTDLATLTTKLISFASVQPSIAAA